MLTSARAQWHAAVPRAGDAGRLAVGAADVWSYGATVGELVSPGFAEGGRSAEVCAYHTSPYVDWSHKVLG